jgi:hypothetical protein
VEPISWQTAESNSEPQLASTADSGEPQLASTEIVALRENEAGRVSKASSKRNSLDNKSVQSLAKDLAAECAKVGWIRNFAN